MAMVTNLTILPAMLLWMEKALQKKARKKEPVESARRRARPENGYRLGLDEKKTDSFIPEIYRSNNLISQET